MGVSGPKDLAKALGLDRAVERVHETLRDEADVIGEIGQDAGRHVILTSPTEGDWSDFYAGNPRQKASERERTGRVDSGQMLEDYTYQWSASSNGVEIEVGWVGGDEGYYADQEYGFVNTYDNGKSVSVPGMNAQETSQPDVRRKTEAILEQLTRGVF